MRCARGLSIGLLAFGLIASAIGCRNQSAPLTNPFLTPDRVPPPSTRVLTPGTAQPYYPGDPLPGAAPLGAPVGAMPPATTFPPATTLPPGGTYTPPATVPPATAYPGAAYPGSPITPTAPTASPYGPRAGDSIRVPSDGQQARLAAATTPIQKLVPPSQDQLAASSIDRPFMPNAGAQAPIKQAAYDETPPLEQPPAQRVQIREVTPAEYATPTAGQSLIPTRDGFRPQGSEPQDETSTESPLSNGFRSPGVDDSATADGSARYGVGPSQQWLRGQLEYWPQTGEWSIKYMPEGQVDQIGGRILIDNPQVLGHLPPGEFVMVEGQVFGRQIDDATYRPAYRVAVVRRQQK
ncbi:MAG TPA: hypothetical protein VF175_05905 [Lacipirellula sp.]